MKNYDELTNDLLKRRDRYVADQWKRRKQVIGLIASLCSFCFVVLLGFGIWQSRMFDERSHITLGDSIDIREKDYIDPDEFGHTLTSPQSNHGSQNNSQTDTKQNYDPIRIVWTINKVDNQVSAAKLNFSTDKYYSEKKTLKDMTEYLGRDLSKLEAVMPHGFAFFGRYETDFFYELDGNIAYDSCVFGYKKGEQQITIMVSKIGVPYDCIYIVNDPTVSILNGVEVMIGGIYKADNSGEFELVFVDFSHAGLQYRVTIENVPYDDYKCIHNIVIALTN